jgi:hypothetical protein
MKFINLNPIKNIAVLGLNLESLEFINSVKK